MNGPIGEKLMAGLEEVFQYVGDLFKPENIQGFFETVSSGISTVKGVFDVLWPVVKIAVEWFALYKAGMLAYEAYTAIAALSTMGFSGAVGQLTLALLANPLGLVIGLLTLVGVSIYEVYQHWDGIKEWFTSVAQTIGDAFASDVGRCEIRIRRDLRFRRQPILMVCFVAVQAYGHCARYGSGALARSARRHPRRRCGGDRGCNQFAGRWRCVWVEKSSRHSLAVGCHGRARRLHRGGIRDGN